MGKIVKAIPAKSKETLSPYVKNFVDVGAALPPAQLPQHLSTFPSRWPFQRGDLNHWIPLLNHFDNILETFCKIYNLHEGPQTRDFDCELLKRNQNLDFIQDDEASHSVGRRFGEDADREVVEAILKFSEMLLENCGNRSLYSSSPHLNDLLHTTSLSLLECTLRVASQLAQRFQASYKRMSAHGKAVSSSLLAAHYNIDLDRMLQLALPFVKTTISTDDSHHSSTTTPSAKGKEKASFNIDSGHVTSVTTSHANDLVSLVKNHPSEKKNGTAAGEDNWDAWGNARVTYYTKPGPKFTEPIHTHPLQSSTIPCSVAPSTPSPVRRTSHLGSNGGSQRGSRLSGSDGSQTVRPSPSTFPSEDTQNSTLKVFEIPSSKLLSSSIHALLDETLPNVPKEAQFELLTKIRVASALTNSLETRRQLLACRILAITNLAYIHNEQVFHDKVLKQDLDEPRRLQLIHQLAELIHPPADGHVEVPRSLQIVVLNALISLTGYSTRFQDVCSALNTSVNHGVLLYIVRQAVAEMAVDDNQGLKATEADEWRKAILTLLTQVSATNRTGTELVAAGLLPILVEVLTLRTDVAKRHHHAVIQFLDTIVYNVKDAFQTLISAGGLDAISDLIVDEVHDAVKNRFNETSAPDHELLVSFRTPLTDYKIPYFQRVTMQWLLKFIHHMMTSAGGYGGNFDRLLRNLIDSPKLLEALRIVISSSTWFGSTVWTNAVSILNDFINNEPTSFAVIAEAGLGKAFLEEVSGEPVVVTSSPPTSPSDDEQDDSPEPSDDEEEDDEHEGYIAEEQNIVEEDPVATALQDDTENAVPPTTEHVDSSEPLLTVLAAGVMPSVDAINIIPQAFGALCLNDNGMRMFQASSALQKYFEIFLSPKHVAVMNNDHEIPASLGSSFDELVRHHPPLREDIINAVFHMVGRVNQLCMTKALKDNVGAKLFAVDSEGRSVIADEGLNALPTNPFIDEEMTEASQQTEAKQPARETDDSNFSITPYVTVASQFLTMIFSNLSVRIAFIEKGGIEPLLNLAQLPSLAYNFGESKGCGTIQGVISLLAESKPHLVMPSLVQRLQAELDVLRPFSEHNGSFTYFASFVNQPRAARSLANGTRLVKALRNVHCLTQALKDCFQGPMFSHSRSNTSHNQINLADLYIDLAHGLGSLYGAVTKEKILLYKDIPDRWKRPSIRSRETLFTNDSVAQTPSLESEIDRAVSANADSEAVVAENTSEPDRIRSSQPKNEMDSTRQKNFNTLGYLLKIVQAAIPPSLQILSKNLVNKRHDAFQRQSHVLVAEALADTMLQQLKERKFKLDEDACAYLIQLVTFVREMLVDKLPSEKPVQSITIVLKAFKARGGFDVLNEMLDKFSKHICTHDSDDVAVLMRGLAEQGLHSLLEIYGILSNGKNITEATQTGILVNRPVEGEAFSPAQFVVELRMCILPSVRRLWESDIIEKGSSQVSNDLINIIRTIALGDSEQGAHKRADTVPTPNSIPPKKFKQHAENFVNLTASGYHEDLVVEALFRCNNSHLLAAEYCEFHSIGRAGRRIPPPAGVHQPTIETADTRPPSHDAGTPMSLDHPVDDFGDPDDGTPQLPNPVLPSSIAADLEFAAALGGPSSSSEGGVEPGPATTSNSSSYQFAPAAENEDTSKPIFIDDLNDERAAIREKLIDRSLDVINAHGEVTFEISALITAIIARSPDSQSMRKEMGETLVNALMSFAGEDDVRPAGKKIAAYAHLLALMLQDKDFYNATLAELKENLSSLISFVRVSPDHTTGESSPWIANILLIVEILLCDDAQPKECKWTPPKDDSPPPDLAPLELTEPSVPDEEKTELFTAILELLPRVGKDTSLALAILRIFVILTRTRCIAKSLGEKKNIQRLFVLAKGLAGSFTERLQSPLLTILRHIIEDDDTVKQIMRAEIKAHFSTPRSSQRHLDLQNYMKLFSHLVIRSPKIFVDVTNDMVKLTKWHASATESTLRQPLALKETATSSPAVPKTPEDSVLPTVQATEDLTLVDVKTSTEAPENGTVEKVKQPTDHKTPIVENPDGVIFFLLTELLNYRDATDKEVLAPPTTEKLTPTEVEKTTSAVDSEMPDAPPTPSPHAIPESEAKDSKKATKEFKPADHPIYIYRCLLLQCLTELLSSYNRAKIEFISYKRNAPNSGMTPSRPRSSVVNHLLLDLIPIGSLDHPETSAFRKKQTTSTWADSVLCALLSKTGEQSVDESRHPSDGEDEPDLLFVRRFVLEHILKAYKEASSSVEPLDQKYSRMLSLADLMNHIMAGKDGQVIHPDSYAPNIMMRSQSQLKRIMYEKGYISALTSSIADIDLNFPGAKRAVKYILRPLKLLTRTAIDLSESATVALPGQEADDEISSASSVSDADEREETPDLFRNSALGMFEGAGDEESSSESGPDDQEIYEDGYEDEEMEYDEEMDEDDENNVSDVDAELEAMDRIEGLSGDIGIEMSDDDEEEDDVDEDLSEDDDEGVEDDEMEDDDARIEIIEENEDVEGEDENDWESHDEDEEDYERQAEEEVEEQPHDMDHTAAEILRRMEEDGLDPADLGLEGYMDDVMDEDEEDEEEEDDEMDDEMMYGDYPGDPLPRQMGFDWGPDFVDPSVVGAQRGSRARHGLLPPPFPFLPGGPRDHPLGGRSNNSIGLSNRARHVAVVAVRRLPGGQNEVEIAMTDSGPVPDYAGGGRYRSHRPQQPGRAADDGVNPLLQRSNNNNTTSGDSGFRASGIGSLLQAISGPGRDFLDMPGRGPFGESSVAFINELLNSGPLPVLSRHGHQLHLHINGTSGDMRREFQAMFGLSRGGVSRLDPRRDVPPSEAVSFSPQCTTFRWKEEARILFGPAHQEKAAKILNALLNVLVPPAWEAEKIALAAEKERIRKQLEEDKKRAEEEKIAREAKEAKDAEEKAEREKKEAEEREKQVAVAAAEAANTINTNVEGTDISAPEPDTVDAMEGVESTNVLATEPSAETPAADRPRITTMIRGSPYDITDLGIDPEFLNELPEEIKEEVIMSAVADRRSQAAATGAQPSEIDREFLEALPADIRDEIVQQERVERRRREREEARRAAAASGGPGLIPQDMDAASIFATMSPELRRQVLMEQDDETIAQLPAELAAQAHALNRQHRAPVQRDGPPGPGRRHVQVLRDVIADDLVRRPQRRAIAEMLDKSGVATLMRLMFVLQHGGLRSILCNVLQNVCENRNNRAEVITTLLLILQDGSADMSAVERGFAQLSLRAKVLQSKEIKDPKDPKNTPGALAKRPSIGFSSPGAGASALVHGSTDISPLVVIQQCLHTLCYLSQVNPHISSFFLTEHEAAGGLKRSLSKKGKGKDTKAAKYALNSLLSLLDRNLIMESSSVMESLSDLLGRVTSPLQGLERKQKEAQDEIKKAEEAVEAAGAPPAAAAAETTMGVPEAASSPRTVNSSEMQVEQPTESTVSVPQPEEPAAVNAEPESTSMGVAENDKEKKIAVAKEAREAAYKKLRAFAPPVIPEPNLKLVINIFVARECSSKTFRETLSTIKNLSAIPGAKEAFGRELIRKAQGLGEIILLDLGHLLPQIEKASTGTEIQGIALAKFSPSSSDQNKLLRVLTALDHLFDPKANSNSTEEDDQKAAQKQDLLATLYENSTFGPMWDKLSACLTAIHQREHMLNVATILLPLIESLMVVCKNTTLKDVPAPQVTHEMSLTSPPPESRMESLFFTFTEEHRKILNDLVRHTPKLMSGTFSLLVKNPKVLEFDNKRNYFNRSIHNRNQQTRVSFPPLQLSVRRDNVFHDSYKSLAYKSPDEMKYGKLSIRFHGEEGVDAGGVTREWFQVLSRQMFDPDYALFVPVSSDRTTFHPNLLSSVNQEHLSFFKFIGRVIGKALFEGRALDCHFSRAVYKRILGKPVSVKDMESLDPDYYKSLTWMLGHNITDILSETFSLQNDKFGLVETVDLIENGRNIAVTEDNKQEYVKLVVEHKLQKSVQEQLDHFLTGFHEIIPAELVAIFNENELELLISGLPEIDVDDWKSNTEYHNYSAASPQIQWFWRAVRSFDKEERAKLLQFVTGTSKVPLNGFKELEGMNGFSRFNIHRDYGSKERLPSSHTCFNQLDIPEYESYEALRQHLLLAITTGGEYFGFA